MKSYFPVQELKDEVSNFKYLGHYYQTHNHKYLANKLLFVLLFSYFLQASFYRITIYLLKEGTKRLITKVNSFFYLLAVIKGYEEVIGMMGKLWKWIVLTQDCEYIKL